MKDSTIQSDKNERPSSGTPNKSATNNTNNEPEVLPAAPLFGINECGKELRGKNGYGWKPTPCDGCGCEDSKWGRYRINGKLYCEEHGEAIHPVLNGNRS